LCLAPADLGGINLRLSFVHEDHFSRLRHGAKLAAAIPNAGLQDLQFKRFSKDNVSLFYDVRPHDAVAQSDRVTRLLDKAVEQGVDVIVLPELCADAQVFTRVRAWRAARPTGLIPVIVAGSRHVERADDGPGENEALVIFSTGEETTHRKISPYVFRERVRDDGTPSQEEIERREFIGSRTNALTVHYSGDWSMTVAICKDILEMSVLRALEDLRIRLVLVPACSDKTDLIESHAVQLSKHAQAAVIIANLPITPDGARAVFAMPAKVRGFFVSRSSDLPAPPVICVLDTQATPKIIILEI
jgi:predicted amidohydrolase